MDWFGPACEVDTVQEQGVLFFHVTEQRRKVDFLTPVACVAACGVAIGFDSAIGALVLAAFSAYFLYRLKDLGTYTVEVTEAKLASMGNLGKFGGSSSTFRWREIHGLEYGNLGEDGPSGLCVKTGRWSLACIAPGISLDQAISMIREIYQCFPSPPLAPEPPNVRTVLKEAFGGIFPSKQDRSGS